MTNDPSRLWSLHASLRCMDDIGGFDPEYRWTDAGGRDPDSYSVTLRRYHQRLWSGRPLPGSDGRQALQLEPLGRGLVDTALNRSFFGIDEPLFLASDSAIPTWPDWRETEPLRAVNPDLTARVDAAYWPLYGMGGMMLFPGYQIDRQWTINQAKGCLKARIGDRLDLTVECIRLHYAGIHDDERNPLGPTLLRYKDFFDLFGGFSGYVAFWLLQDLVEEGPSWVRFFMEGEIGAYDFTTRRALPQTVDDYVTYLDGAQEFVKMRNARMKAEWERIEEPPALAIPGRLAHLGPEPGRSRPST